MIEERFGEVDVCIGASPRQAMHKRRNETGEERGTESRTRIAEQICAVGAFVHQVTLRNDSDSPHAPRIYFSGYFQRLAVCDVLHRRYDGKDDRIAIANVAQAKVLNQNVDVWRLVAHGDLRHSWQVHQRKIQYGRRVQAQADWLRGDGFVCSAKLSSSPPPSPSALPLLGDRRSVNSILATMGVLCLELEREALEQQSHKLYS